MKKISLLFAALLMTFSANAQTYSEDFEMALDTVGMSKFTAVYDYTIRTTDHTGKAVTDTILLALQVGEGYWKCTPYMRFLPVKDHNKEHLWDVLHQEALMHIETIVSGYPEGKRTIHEAIAPYCYETVEDKEAIEWTLNEADIDSGYDYRRATGEFRGKTWNVLYAENIPTTAGPWKLHGLPGLITHAADNDSTHIFKFVALYNDSLPIIHEKYYVLSVPSSGGGNRLVTKQFQKRTHEQMMDLRKKTIGSKVYASNPKFSFPELGPNDLDCTILNDDCTPRANVINGVTVLDKAHTYQPLELE
ncbi:MAG: GLPGLI family protein [Bacteroidaceae bacterium]|nr:GLPGLI family protein [Bacteroidaceae bacterium]